MLLTLVALVLPLGLDTFAVAAALGMAGLAQDQRWRVTIIFTAFETGMPLLGFLGGQVFGRAAGEAADFAAIAIIVFLGAYLLWPRPRDPEAERVTLLARTRGLAALGLGVSISLDELAIGFTLGLLRLPVPLVIVLIGIQTILVVQLGIRIGTSVGGRVREGAERLAGAVLIALAIVLLVEKIL